jgi:hypothetical protein
VPHTPAANESFFASQFGGFDPSEGGGEKAKERGHRVDHAGRDEEQSDQYDSGSSNDDDD